MSIDLNRLKTLPRDELLEVAKQSGVAVHHKQSIDTIAKNIIEKVINPPVPTQSDKHVAELSREPVIVNTAEEVEAAIAGIKKNAPRLQSKYDNETWHFQWVNDRGVVMREDCGNLAIPLRVIKQKAAEISRGPLLLRGLNQHFDALPVSGNSLYTNTVLA